jgi:hypothetical protein
MVRDVNGVHGGCEPDSMASLASFSSSNHSRVVRKPTCEWIEVCGKSLRGSWLEGQDVKDVKVGWKTHEAPIRYLPIKAARADAAPH